MTSTAHVHAHGRPDGDACPHCGWPDRAEPFQVLSRHGTGAGLTVWTRCGCGSLQMRVVDARGVRVASRSRPADSRSRPADSRSRTAGSGAAGVGSGTVRVR
ncbi:hypothetical protein [Streptomyces sp. NPDC001815]|uniref:hypothetical protein n=1 Tax=Streptomyces sp. NPDC001815 TaxID=3154526 RepID=UPI00331FC432